jgi:hypothetical protein
MLMAVWLPTLTSAPGLTITEVPDGVAGPSPTTLVCGVPGSQVITLPLVVQAAAAAPPKPSKATATAA